MFFPESTLRIHIYGEPVDMRKSFAGLYGVVRHGMTLDPLSGALFVFISRRGSQMKVLYWDRSGFCIWAKRLERGTFVSDWSTMRTREIDWTQLKLIIEGLIVRAKKYRYLRPDNARRAA